MDSFSKFTQNVSTSWSPFAEKMGKSFTQYKQMASESLGSTGEVTELPTDYITMERRYEAVRQSAISLVKLSKAYTAPPTQFDMQALQSQFFTMTFKHGSKNEAEARNEVKPPATCQHEIARASLDVSEKVGLEEPLGAALFKFGSIEERVGTEKLKQDQTIDAKFIKPMSATLESSIALAQNARKQVQAARLTLDAAKTTFKNARPEKADAARREVETAEDQFVTIVEEAMNLMRAVVESPEPLRCLSEFVAAQLAFHKEAAALLGDLAPEIEEIQVTQEALYRHDNK
ncbi:BAR domain-containing protein [Coemansia guatemalensis]|uniref:BAR domain-containing protein n=1 Tax=Coemansia guatemalensis TaxID=2761395 RepID=A0A9W8HSZ0_9FUNG|nr:BAR domain-containing protein [Coemansia guatemalensis]